MDSSATILTLETPPWRDYELLDSGEGAKLERFGAYSLIRPEVQAMWRRSLPAAEWQRIHAVFRPSGEESGGHWDLKKQLASRWEMSYPLVLSAGAAAGSQPAALRFWAMTTPGRHLGVFPEAASHWDFLATAITESRRHARVLNLFGYTGLASLAAAAAGADVTHVDASKKSVTWARQNQELSGLSDRPIRWIVDDALKFVKREWRRGARYDGILIDPPKFGRGPKGEVWEVYKSLPELLRACADLLSPNPMFVILTVYAVKASGVHMGQLLAEMMGAFPGRLESGELVTRERSAGRLLSQAVFARWCSATAGMRADRFDDGAFRSA
jgi:23S rRNA (cytosine1962-C5)-methyltransferase